MSDPQDLDELLHNWPYDPGTISVRLVKGADNREVIHMRIEMGIMQLETTGRPDGARPEGRTTYLDRLLQLAADTEDMQLTEEQCQQCDREFVQFYHRRICWLALQEYGHAVQDADHTLRLMDFCRRHSPDEQWTLSHEQYRPFVMYHRVQANAMSMLTEDRAEDAVESINLGLEKMREIYAEYELDDEFEKDELVQRLVELRESLRDQFEVGRTLPERLADAIASEQYELAARLRDELASRGRR